MYYKKCPQNQFGELDHQKYKQIEVFYNQKYKQWLPYQILFDIVCTRDVYLFACRWINKLFNKHCNKLYLF